MTDGEELGNPVKSIAVRASEASKVAEMLNAHIWNLRISNTGLEIKKNHLDDLVELLNRNWDAIFSVWPFDQPQSTVCVLICLGRLCGSLNIMVIYLCMPFIPTYFPISLWI